MIIAVAAAAVGVLMCVLAVLLLWKKKLPRQWGASLLACAVIVGAAGGLGIARELRQRTEKYGYIYLALCYLEQNEPDPAALYLRRVSDQSGYHLAAAQTLLEQVRGNDIAARLRLDVLKNLQNGSDEQTSGVTRLQTWSQMDNGLHSVTAALRGQLPLSDRRRLELDQVFALETGGWAEGAREDREDALLLQINQSLHWQDWSGALNAAIGLVREDASASNRLLLAEIIADVTYSGGGISTYQFGPETERDTQHQEAEKLLSRYDELADELAVLDQQLLLAEGEERERLADKSAELTQEAESVQNRARNIFALRALNSIADIHSLEAQVVRARLYYAMRSYQEAVDILRQSSHSAQAALSWNRPLVSALRLVDQVYATQGETGVDSPEFREELQILLGSVHPELIQLGLTPLASDFAERIISDQKEYGSDLYVIDLDASQYPLIRVRLGGQSEGLDAIARKELVVISDTRTAVTSYEVEYNSAEEGLNSICFVVDTSGSMDGSPIRDAREALGQFLTQVTGNAELALVKFESTAETLVELTDSVNAMSTAIGSLSGGGGTDITAGIAEGIEVLRTANGARTMIVMTDGQSDIDWNVVQEAADQGITIFTVGFGGAMDDVLQPIADMTGGQYIRADSSAELTNVYKSLQGLVGNSVTVTYTVEDTTELTRYFFLKGGEQERSVRREYYVGGEEREQAEPAVTLNSSPVFQTREYLDRLAEEPDGAFGARYDGTGLDTVATAYAGDYPCGIEGQDEGSLRLNVPARLPNGIYELRLVDREGTQYSFPEMLVIGDRLNVREYRAGGLLMTAQEALQLDGELVLGGVRMSEQPESGTVNTLSARLDGLLVFPYSPPPPEVDENGEQVSLEVIDLGGTGIGRGRGELAIDRDDKAYADYVDTVIVNGPFRLEYDTQQSRIAAGEEDGQ